MWIPVIVHSCTNFLAIVDGSDAQDSTMVSGFGAEFGNAATDSDLANSGSYKRWTCIRDSETRQCPGLFGRSIVVDLDIVHY